MRKVTVPVDTSSEQKSILGIISIRQLLYLGLGGFTIYSAIPFWWNFVDDFTISLFVVLFGSIPPVLIVLPLAFYKVKKYHMFLDRYIITKVMRKSQFGIWRKGREF